MSDTKVAPARILAIDAGTTSVRTLAVNEAAEVVALSQRELTQHYPHPGWVEHDADEIWHGVRATIADVLADDRVDAGAIAAIGITNQRETTVAWDRDTAEPLARAIVWQDRRTADRCDELRASGAEAEIRGTTGLLCDPYFSATKMEWLLRHGGVEPAPGLAFGTVDSWLAFKLTGGAHHVTDASNASRTMLYDIGAGRWSEELAQRFGVPLSALPDVVDSAGDAGTTDAGETGIAVPVAGMAGDQQASLFGQACFTPGATKNTYGTGSFVLVNAGEVLPPATAELVTTVAWRLGGVHTYALEGSIFVTGAAVQWLRDQLGIVADAAEIGPLAASVTDTSGVVFVPALAGLGAPYWDPRARGAVFGLTRGVNRAHLARAVVESMAFQTRDVVAAADRALSDPVAEMRVDGGASVMDVLCQIQADQLGVDVVRTAQKETTALGAAFLAGIATGVWGGLDDVARAWRADRRFVPDPDRGAADAAHAAWRRAVERVVDYAAADPP
ncbi:MAG: glycerol kinase GlpK [Acidimicrobiia bacterium]|nr:glycerol kinase GlpK [Acidimicrobiia bacterium]